MSKRSQEILELYKSAVMPTYTPSVVVSSGKGVTVRDVDGRTYYDFTSGIGVQSVGYGNKKVVEAIKAQAAILTHCSNLFVNEPSTRLAEKLKASGVISGGMLPKIESCEDAIREGVKKVHLVDGRMSHSLLLEIFTRQGVGTEITE